MGTIAILKKEKMPSQNNLKFDQFRLKGVVASYQAALSEEYTPLERVKPVLTWSRGCPGHNKMVSEVQIQ